MRPTKAELALKKKKVGRSPFPKRANNNGQDYGPLKIAPDGLGIVYFYGSPDGTMIKVGYTENNDEKLKRIKNHKGVWGTKGEGKILALVRGTSDNHKSIHRYFGLVPGTEETIWATGAPEPNINALSYLIWLRDRSFTSTSLEELNTKGGMECVDSTMWLPNGTNVSTRQSEPSLLQYDDPWSILPTREITGDDWYTPIEIIEKAREVLGTIELDPATHVIANAKFNIPSIFTFSQNGLIQPWCDENQQPRRIWLNPPFENWKLFLNKAIEEINKGHVHSIIMLGFTRTITAQYFSKLLEIVDAVCVISGRFTFWGHESQSESAPDGVILLYWGPDIAKFTSVMSGEWPLDSENRPHKGTVLTRVSPRISNPSAIVENESEDEANAS